MKFLLLNLSQSFSLCQCLIVRFNLRIIKFARSTLDKFHITGIAGIPQNRAHTVLHNDFRHFTHISSDTLRIFLIFCQYTVLTDNNRNPFGKVMFSQKIKIRFYPLQILFCSPGRHRNRPVYIMFCHAKSWRAVIVDRQNAVICRVCRHLITTGTGTLDIRIVAGNQQMPEGIISPCCTHRIHKKLIHSI